MMDAMQKQRPHTTRAAPINHRGAARAITHNVMQKQTEWHVGIATCRDALTSNTSMKCKQQHRGTARAISIERMCNQRNTYRDKMWLTTR